MIVSDGFGISRTTTCHCSIAVALGEGGGIQSPLFPQLLSEGQLRGYHSTQHTYPQHRFAVTAPSPSQVSCSLPTAHTCPAPGTAHSLLFSSHLYLSSSHLCLLHICVMHPAARDASCFYACTCGKHVCMTLHSSWVMANSWKSCWLLVQPSSAVLLQEIGWWTGEYWVSHRQGIAQKRRKGKERF